MSANNSVSMIGGGSWATALVKVLNENGQHVHWWIRNQKVIDSLKNENHNADYLSSVHFSSGLISPSNNLEAVFSNAGVIFLAVPSAYLKSVLGKFSPKHFRNKLFVSAIKGMIPDENLLIAEYLKKYFQVSEENIVNISGPSHAEEVAMEKLSYITLACNSTVNANRVVDLLNCKFVRCSASDDVEGTEYSAVLKNIYAIAAGIFHGLGYGDNFHAVLISNCIEEMERFLKAVHPIKRDIKDSAYLGDLLVTAYSQFSRNRTLGAMIGKGYSVKNALLEMKMVAEGYYATRCIHEVNLHHKVAAPIAEAVYEILYEEADVKNVMLKVTEVLS